MCFQFVKGVSLFRWMKSLKMLGVAALIGLVLFGLLSLIRWEPSSNSDLLDVFLDSLPNNLVFIVILSVLLIVGAVVAKLISKIPIMSFSFVTRFFIMGSWGVLALVYVYSLEV